MKAAVRMLEPSAEATAGSALEGPEQTPPEPLALPAGRGRLGPSAGVALLARLEGITAARGLPTLASQLGDLADFVATDLGRLEDELAALERDTGLVGRAAGHLLERGGKRLRPMCVLLAAKLGGGGDFAGRRVLDLGVAIELVHSATLLHDDVVDLGESRRGAPTARAVFGNAASVFAGDWLLVEALRRVRRSEIPGLLESLFDTVEEMILAESIQLENRGRISLGRDDYFRVVEGKTASVFRWAMTAGALAGGAGRSTRRRLESYGNHLGIAFQAVDDLLDLTGDATRTGKALFTDLREGKMTYPVILGLERDPSLRLLVETIVAGGPEAVSDEACRSLVRGLRETDAVADGLALAREHSARAVACLEPLPAGRARRALITVAEAVVDRDL